jgi:hypothetical protein
LTQTVRAFCFPNDDVAFVRLVHEAVGWHADREPFDAAVEAMLRETYPLVVVSARAPMAAVDGRTVVYVFRDGRVVPHADEAS